MSAVLDRYFVSDKHFLTRHHLDSYNTFIDKGIKTTIKSMNPFPIIKYNANGDVKHKIEVFVGGEDGNDINFSKPAITPLEARLRDQTYMCDMKANILIRSYQREMGELTSKDTLLRNINLCKIPIMLHSELCMIQENSGTHGECRFDQGGYFVVDGKEKVIVAQESIVTNRLFVSSLNDHDKYKYQAFIRCTSEKDSVFPKTIWFYVLKGMNNPMRSRRNAIVVKIPHIEKQIPIFVLFRALGIGSDKLIIENYINIASDDKVALEFLRDSILDCDLYSQEACLEWLSDFVEFKSVSHVKYAILNNMLPNTPPTFEDKAVYLGYIIKHIVDVCLGRQPESNRDNFMYKRVAVSGYLLSDIFKDFYNNFRVATRTKIDNMYEFGGGAECAEISEFINQHNSEEVFSQSEKMIYGLIKSLKGNWGLLGDASKQGIVQDMNRISYMSFVSHLRRVNLPMDTSVKIRAPHQLNGSQWGVMCPCESPDGASIGLLKNMSILTKVSPGIDTQTIRDAISPFHMTKVPLDVESVRIEINNNFYGYLNQDVDKFVKYVRLLRRCALINSMVSVVWNIFEKKVNIMCDAGRCCRPLIYDLKKSEKVGTWSWADAVFGSRGKDTNGFEGKVGVMMDTADLEKNIGFIEYIDVEEANTCMISFDKKHRYATHFEIHPTTMFSAYTSTIPLSNHNQAPRNIFSGAQGKQAIGVYATNFPYRIETMSYILHYPQKPLVTTKYTKYLNADILPNGENVIVAIATYTGYNQEDSIIINKNSVERGLFNLSYYKSHIGQDEDIKGGSKLSINNPNHVSGCEINRFANYTKLDDNGLPIVNSYIKEGDALLGKVLFNAKEGKYTSKCDIANKTTDGFIDKVVVYPGKDGRVAKIRMRKVRYPEFGDKLASRHGQKGVIGAILPQEMMPFNKDGIVPDIIVNPHAFPSRMTIGHLIECILAKTGTYQGCCYDATPFDNHDFENVYDILEKKYKLDKYGDELMYNGITGEQIQTKIFFGPTYYFRLKHMVADKVNYRLEGKVVSMTKQPTKGRGNEGGLRIGEMETNAILSHGVSAFMKESMMERSDKYRMFVEDDHGRNTAVNLPYTFKLFDQELQTMSVKMIPIKNDEQIMYAVDNDVDDFDGSISSDEDELNADA